MLRNFLLLTLVALTAGVASAQNIRASKPVADFARSSSVKESSDGRVYELRTYFASPGKLDDLHNRFKNHLLGFHEKHGITNIGYWVPTDNPKRMIVALVSYPSMEARDRSWSRLSADREWIQARRESEENGRILDAIREEVLSADEATDVMTLAMNEGRGFEIHRFTAESGQGETVKARVREELNDEFGKSQVTVRFFTPTGEGNRTATTLLAFIVRPVAEVDVVEFVMKRGSTPRGGLEAAKIPGQIVTTLKVTEYSPAK